MRTALILAIMALEIVNAQQVSTSGKCGAAAGGITCARSIFGNCCSQYGWCGSSLAYCGTGCQSDYGTGCSSPSTGGLQVLEDGSCGGDTGYTCQGSSFGNCCSQYGWCGRTVGESVYCGTGCNPLAGTCNNPASSSSIHVATTLSTATRSPAATPSPAVKVSNNARCGNTEGATGGLNCIGSQWGDCCSQYGYCGSTSLYCGNKCQAGFGKCDAKVSSSSSHLSSATSSKVSSASSSSQSSLKTSSVTSSLQTSSAASSIRSSSISNSAASTTMTITSQSSTRASSSSASSTRTSSSSATATRASSSSSSNQTSSSSASSAKASSSSVSSTMASSSSASSTRASSSSDSSTMVSSSSSFTQTSSSSDSSTTASSSSATSSKTSYTSTVTSIQSPPSAAVSSTQLSSSAAVLPTQSSPSVAGSSSVPSAAPSASCLVTPTNYVDNGDFETGNIAPWTTASSARLNYAIESGLNAHSRQYAVVATGTSNVGQSTITFRQSGISIAAGTEINVNVYVKSFRKNNDCRFTVYFDNDRLGYIRPSGSTVGDWKQVGTGASAVGYNVKSKPNDLHDLVVEFSCDAVSGLPLFALDDASIVAIKGPNNAPLCPSSP